MVQWSAIEKKVDSIEGWMMDLQRRWLFETAQSLGSGASILEVGSFKGLSTACLGFGCVGSERHVWTIDTFCGNQTDMVPGTDYVGNMKEEFDANIERLDLEQYVSSLVGKSCKFWHLWESPIDFLFIDGSHQYEDVLGDFVHFGSWVVPGGLIAMHDVRPEAPWPGPWRVWKEKASGMLGRVGTVQTTLRFGFKSC